jgi:hypothetical protein
MVCRIKREPAQTGVLAEQVGATAIMLDSVATPEPLYDLVSSRTQTTSPESQLFRPSRELR